MPRRLTDLSALPWQLGQAPRQPFSATPQDDRGSVTEWLPARVPGDVRADLIAAGRIPSVRTPDGIAAGAWVDDHDWWYRVELPGNHADAESVILESDGIDYYSAIWLDDRLLTTHAGMFSRQTVILSPWINASGPHELAIRVWGGGALPGLSLSPLRKAQRWMMSRLYPGLEYYPDRMATTKAQFSFGWDFSPRLLTAGIWEDTRLITARGAYIDDLWVRVQPLSADLDPTPALCWGRLRVTRWQPGQVRAEITLEPENFADAGYQTVNRIIELCADDDVPCTDEYDFELDMAVARRWWPWDQDVDRLWQGGESALYRVSVRLVDGRGVMDEITQVVGVRSVARETLPNGAPWRFIVNGRSVFLRGANWVPADVLPGRITEADYQRLIGLARDAGINFLRVWGGGIREKRAFWDTCDRLGILAWQEFPLACASLDHYPRTSRYRDLLLAEARGTVRALRNHPSLIAWCGGNEISPSRELPLLSALADVVRQGDPDRPWIPASPSDGAVHQWDVWHGHAPWTVLANETAPFMSEFGMQALPHRATVEEMFPDGVPASLVDPRWPARKAQIAKLRRYAGPDAAADAGGDLDAAIAATQRAQAVALQVGIEACRLRRVGPPPTRVGPPLAPPTRGRTGWLGWRGQLPPLQGGSRGNCGGVVFWQYNEPWYAVSWSVIDRAGRPKAAFEMLRRSYQPVLIAARFPWRRYGPGDPFRAAIWLVNDGVEDWSGCRAVARLEDRPVWEADDVDLPAASAHQIGTLETTLSAAPGVLELALFRGDTCRAANRYDLGVHLPGPQPLRGRLNRWLADWVLKTG